jgi:Mrp family chromosome partitioning ATPase
VLYDVPAGATGSDALAVAARAAGVLLVTRKNATSLSEVAALSDQLAQNSVTIVGSVLVSF